MRIETVARIWKAANSYVVTVPKGYVNQGLLKENQQYIVKMDFEEIEGEPDELL